MRSLMYVVCSMGKSLPASGMAHHYERTRLAYLCFRRGEDASATQYGVGAASPPHRWHKK
jgi:hypothetical protein